MTDGSKLHSPIEKELAEFLTVRGALRDDANHWWRSLQTNREDPFVRRAAVRATMAMIEGVVHRLKKLGVEMLLYQAEYQGKPLSLAEWALLSDERHDLDDDGRVRPSDARTPLRKNLPFTFSMLWRLTGHSGSLIDTRGRKYKELLQAVAVRNRLVHPKCRSDCDVSDSDLLLVNRACAAFDGWTIQLLREVPGQQVSGTVVQFRPKREDG